VNVGAVHRPRHLQLHSVGELGDRLVVAGTLTLHRHPPKLHRFQQRIRAVGTLGVRCWFTGAENSERFPCLNPRRDRLGQWPNPLDPCGQRRDLLVEHPYVVACLALCVTERVLQRCQLVYVGLQLHHPDEPLVAGRRGLGRRGGFGQRLLFDVGDINGIVEQPLLVLTDERRLRFDLAPHNGVGGS